MSSMSWSGRTGRSSRLSFTRPVRPCRSASSRTTLLHRDIRSIVAELPSDEANVIRMRYGLDDDKPMTLDEISKIVHTTRQAVSRVESRAKLRLFAKAVSQDMQLYLTD